MVEDIQTVIDDVFGLYIKYGEADYIGEPISQLEHASQTAELAMHEGYADEVILAAFFHDIGHICAIGQSDSMEGYGTVAHEKLGADLLRSKGFSQKIATLVENHVQAKRYLTYKYPEYYNALSEASKKTLSLQGGVMTEPEAISFEKDAFFELSILMRKWDELAKEINKPQLNLDVLKSKAHKVLKNHAHNFS